MTVLIHVIRLDWLCSLMGVVTCYMLRVVVVDKLCGLKAQTGRRIGRDTLGGKPRIACQSDTNPRIGRDTLGGKPRIACQ